MNHPNEKLNKKRKAALYMTLYGSSYGYHLLWLLSVELGVKIPPIVQSSVPRAVHAGKYERCATCKYFDADDYGEYGWCTVGYREHEDHYCITFERRT